MPIYEYRCDQCRHKSSHFFRSFTDSRQLACSSCGSTDLVRIMSTFTFNTPWYSGMNIPSSETLGDFDEDDQRNTAKWVQGMRRDMGPTFGGEYEDLVQQLETGGLGDDSDTKDVLDY